MEAVTPQQGLDRGTIEPKRPLEVPMLLDVLGQSIEKLHAIIDGLDDRLASVTIPSEPRPVAPSSTTAPDEVPPTTLVGQRLDALVYGVRGAQERIADTIRRLEL